MTIETNEESLLQSRKFIGGLAIAVVIFVVLVLVVWAPHKEQMGALDHTQMPADVATGAPTYNVGSPHITTTPSPSGPIGGGVSQQPTKIDAPMPMPAEHPYDPKYPVSFPPQADPTRMTTAGGEPVTNPPVSFVDSGTKPPYHQTHQPKVTKAAGKDTLPPITPHTLTPTTSNEYKIDIAVNSSCPVLPPSGKLELAIKAWTNGNRQNEQHFDVGSVDMGTDGGWFDYDNKGCCDYYFRRIGEHAGGRASSYWAAITPQAPHMEYTKLNPRGLQCSAFAGPPISRQPVHFNANYS